ncbi:MULTISPECIES: hypothetical protein [Ralstonia]|uniref:hypothetical protein n=1 Tax=Ralstonia TaxID=48736 RepID=UPI000385E99F|nr:MULTISPECIES: hypothetical protein [Ralstonia]EPX94595.1 hypothetical protein C404_27660 [Ralstonia sp. AU12-08]MBY4706196.1 hypothetical protein [Ralstonia insidiosa]GAQ27243.1 hypothetical protein SAMD00023378_0926 [Ralstonia sp. NT80]
MKPTLQERQELKKLFTNDVDRMLLCLKRTGVAITDDEVVQAWAEYSDANHADWLGLPESDEALRKLLIKYVAIGRSRVVWRVTGADAEDGTGDFIVPLPTELSEQLGWQSGDELSIERIEPDTLRLRRI